MNRSVRCQFVSDFRNQSILSSSLELPELETLRNSSVKGYLDTIPKYSFLISVKNLVNFSTRKLEKICFFDNLIDQKSFENVSNV